MKKILLLLAVVGVIFTACEKTGGFDDNKKEMPTDEIWYTSTDGEIVTPHTTDVFGANIVSNTYDNGMGGGVITFDGNVTQIGRSAFVYCTSLTAIAIPDSVTWIGNHAFEGCTSLTSVSIGSGVTSIGVTAFAYCTSLRSITIPDSVTSIKGGAFAYCSSLRSITIPDGVTSIEGNVFHDCTSLTAFYGKYASADNRCLIINRTLRSFAIGCGATEYTIPDSVTSIWNYAFSGCTSLTSVTIPDSVALIMSSAFSGCTSLTSVTIPDSVTSIWDYAFDECDSLAEVYCKPTTPPTGRRDMFGFNASGRKIYVPAASVEAYKSAEYWRDYADDIVGYDF